ncbi:conserved Plasmodium protein, unknown function [Plasmodium vivax]|uniref:Uncharacterized protein n=1 Tax=Plasmodium vivax TaxID=5855 RepID=A0A564ZU23_PLAVI|nr:conserved Plasmodium protein, unknown function [Plasmodium vivax]
MVTLASFLLASEKRITSVRILEGALAYYVVKRLSSLFFDQAGTHYGIEICSCEELRVSNLFHSKVIHFGGVDADEELAKFLQTVVLREEVAKIPQTAVLHQEQPHLSKNSGRASENGSRWNVYVLKSLHLLYANGRGTEKKHFGELASYVISLLHRENGVIERKDKLLFLILFFFLFTKRDPWKGRSRHVGGRRSQFVMKADRRGKKKKKEKITKIPDDFKSFYEQLRRRRFNKLRLRSARKFLLTGLCHVQLIREGANELHTGGGKKRVLILCKKSLRYLSEVCANWQKSANRENGEKRPNCLNGSGELAGEEKKRSAKEKRERLKNAPLWKLLHKVNHREGSGWRSDTGRRKCANLGTAMEGPSEEGGPNQNGLNHVRLCKRLPSQDALFSLTCVCISLLCNTNGYNHYYRLVSLLRERRSFHLHDRVNRFVNELAKLDAKCQHIWNMKNALLYLYVEMCLKRGHQVVKKRRRKKASQSLSRMGVSTNRKGMPTEGLPSKVSPSLTQKKKKKKKHACTSEQILKYVKDTFQFFDDILQIKSHNYMATSHICTFNQLLNFLCVGGKNSRRRNTPISKMIEKRFHTVVRKNAYYYAVHNSFLLVHLQHVYLSLVDCLRRCYCVVVRTNLFTYSFDSVRGHELCSDARWGVAGNHHCGSYPPEKCRSSHHKSTYLEFLLFERGGEKKKKKNYEQVRKVTPQMLHTKLKSEMKKYKILSRQMIHLLDKLYSEKFYIHFYSNGLRNALYCRCNCNFFFLEVVCSVILPLQLEGCSGGKDDSPVGGSDERKGTSAEKNHQTERKKHTQGETSRLLRSVDRYLAKELKYLFHEYTRFRVKYGEEKKNNLTKRIGRLLKRCTHVRNTWHHCRASTKGNIKTKRNGWIVNGLLSVGQHGQHDRHSHLRKEKTQRKGEATCPPVLVSYYGIFFKCIIYTIHEYALQICGMLRGRLRRTQSSSVDREHLQRRTCPHRLLSQFEETKQCGGSIPHDTLNCNDNLHTLYVIYLDILLFFKAMKMRDWHKRGSSFGHLANCQPEVPPRRGPNERPFLKFLFSANFRLFLCEHRYAFYLLREVRRALQFVFPRVKRRVERRGRPG